MSMTTRQPPGAPAGSGGEFAPRYAPAVDIPLDWSADGSYAYPADPQTADQLVAFWRNVEIPEHVLRQVDAEHREAWHARRIYLGIEFEKANPIPRSDRDREAWEARKEAFKREGMAGIPPYIHVTQVRPLVRIAKMLWASSSLPADQRALFREMRFPLPGGVTMTAAEAVEGWRLKDIVHAFEDKGEPAERLLDRLDAEN